MKTVENNTDLISCIIDFKNFIKYWVDLPVAY